MNIDPIHAADLRTAIHIKKALDNIHRLNKLGYCPTKVQKFRKYFNLDGREEEGSGNNTDEESSGNNTDEESSGNNTDEEGSGNNTDEEGSGNNTDDSEEGSGNNTDEEDSSGGNETPEKGFKRRDLVNQVCK